MFVLPFNIIFVVTTNIFWSKTKTSYSKRSSKPIKQFSEELSPHCNKLRFTWASPASLNRRCNFISSAPLVILSILKKTALISWNFHKAVNHFYMTIFRFLIFHKTFWATIICALDALEWWVLSADVNGVFFWCERFGERIFLTFREMEKWL